MNKIFLKLSTLLLFVFPVVKGQVFHNLEEVEIFETRLKIQNFISTLISYPFESLEKKEIGVLIGEIKLNNSDQQDSVYVVNSISKNLDELFITALKITLVNYRAELEKVSENNEVTFYVIFKIENNEFEISYKNIPKSFIGPMKMTLSNIIKSTNPQEPERKIEIKPDSYFLNEIEENRLKIENLEEENKDNSPLKQKLNSKLIYNKENQIIDNLDELIRRNPFNPELLEQRVQLYKKHNEEIKAEKDISFLQNYIVNTENQ